MKRTRRNRRGAGIQRRRAGLVSRNTPGVHFRQLFFRLLQTRALLIACLDMWSIPTGSPQTTTALRSVIEQCWPMIWAVFFSRAYKCRQGLKAI